VTALDDALAAAQSRAIAALGKRYVRAAEPQDDETVQAEFYAIGFTDERGIAFLLSAWKILREQGEQAPGEQEPKTAEPEPASDAQWKFIRDLADRKGAVAPEGPLTKAQAHEIIESLQAGTYDPDKWTVPF
jgi:hypothetical protein